MPMRLAAVAALVATLAVAWPTAAAERLTLDDAFARVASSHPQLRLFESQQRVLTAERDRAAQSQPLVLGVQLEDAAGSGALSGLDAAELTVTLASVLERGGKLDARRVLAQSRIDALAMERATRRLDLLAEVARRFLALDVAGLQRDIARRELAQRQRAVEAARARFTAGASPEAIVLSAEAERVRSEITLDRQDLLWRLARQQLAALWGEREPAFDIEAADPLQLPQPAGEAALVALLDGTPELQRFADERRLREARLQLARSDAAPDLEWQLGIRRHEAGNDFALVAGVSLPLGARTRAQPQIRAASEELAQLELEREAVGLSLYATLLEALGRYQLAQQEVRRLGVEVLPALRRAEAAAERAYRAGAISYLEWAQLQADITATERQQLDVAADAQLAMIEIQRLTGQPSLARTDSQGKLP
ncbi:MAG TPA: TolC family protein [Steroidobacteraceae bacterium]|nr:TolC family protein [Steroidobacteraceae bacterium]